MNRVCEYIWLVPRPISAIFRQNSVILRNINKKKNLLNAVIQISRLRELFRESFCQQPIIKGKKSSWYTDNNHLCCIHYFLKICRCTEFKLLMWHATEIFCCLGIESRCLDGVVPCENRVIKWRNRRRMDGRGERKLHVLFYNRFLLKLE